MSPPRVSLASRSARLLSLLTLAATGCSSTETHEACYEPGAPIGEVPTQMPDLPCLGIQDSLLNVLNPGCTEDFRIRSGPSQRTSASNATSCCYTVEYTRIDGCQVGRPLRQAGRTIVASLRQRDDWTS